MNNFFQIVGCKLIGWNRNILNQCGEASFRQFRKLLSAVTIMMVLWGVIGFNFADRYINLDSKVFNCLVAIVFMVIILCIERVIILTFGKARFMAVMRFCLALCMAILGSCIFDQIIFRNDIEGELKQRRENEIKETILKRMSIYEGDQRRIASAMDSTSQVTDKLNEKLQARPTITMIDGATKRDSTGKVTERTITKTSMPNPLIEQVKANNKQIESYADQLRSISDKKEKLSEDVKNEVLNRERGFIEELEATLAVVSSSLISMFFYCVMFLFLMFLELFVLSIKMGDAKCDYDLLVEHQLSIKRGIMQTTEDSLTANK